MKIGDLLGIDDKAQRLERYFNVTAIAQVATAVLLFLTLLTSFRKK